MAGNIFLIQDSGVLVEMKEQPYDSEALLQELLATYPSVLAGDSLNDQTPRRFLLVSREVPVPDQEAGSGRWSLDHLFLDQDGVPTLVEVKRSTDSRIRREVVGQMLDYAANGPVYWPVDSIQAALVARCQRQKLEPEQVLTEFLGPEFDRNQFWQRVKDNLKAGKVRLVFVADEIPTELRRIVEFLNEQMDPAEVLAVEIRQYVSQGLKTLVPRVIGQTAQAAIKKRGEFREWDENSFFSELEGRGDTTGCAVARAILEWARAQNLRIEWGTAPKEGGFTPILDHRGGPVYPISVRTGTRNSYVQVQFAPLRKRPPFNDDARRDEIRIRLNAIPGVNLPPESGTKYPGILLSSLTDESARHILLQTLAWVLEEVRQH
jgi:hypothetical protein